MTISCPVEALFDLHRVPESSDGLMGLSCKLSKQFRAVQPPFPPALLLRLMIKGYSKLFFFHVALDRFVHIQINDLRGHFFLTDLREMKLLIKSCHSACKNLKPSIDKT